MWFKIKSYFTFLSKSTNQHGVHSPFVYDLVTKCFYKKTNSDQVALFNKIKTFLYQNHTIIKIDDFGKGSKIFKSNHRKVSDIAKIAGISEKKAKLLIRFVSYFNFETMLEIGTSVGLGSAALKIGKPTATLTTLEGCLNTGAIAQQMFQQFDLEPIKLEVGNFDMTLPIVTNNKTYDLIYFDGNHQKEPTLNYFNQCLETVHNNSVFVFDDIYWSPEMEAAWEIIKKHPKVIITINTYHFGFVFFRKEQPKQHFTIRC